MAAFIRNQTRTTSNQGMVSSFEAMWGQTSNLYNLPFFGCKSQVHILNTLRRKLDAKTKDCIFLKYAEKVKARVFEYVALGQLFVSQGAIVRRVMLNLKPKAGPSSKYQSKIGTTKESLEQQK